MEALRSIDDPGASPSPIGDGSSGPDTQGGGVQDVLVIGEALVDIVSAPGVSAVEHAGGSPANVALGLSRLGLGTRLLTRIGSDERGQLIRRHLEASGVSLV